MQEAVAKYLRVHAEIGARALWERLGDSATFVSLHGTHVLVVPAYAEEVSFLDGLLGAAAGGLLVIVLNSPEGARPEVLQVNDALRRELEARFGRAQPLEQRLGMYASRSCGQRVLLVDATELPQAIFTRQGVGLARKLGNDVAVALWARGRLRSPWLHQADADVTLPADLAQRAHRFTHQPDSGALVYPFRHIPSGHQDVGLATFQVEAKLRYHVLGLRWARSPYAWHSIGSCIAVRADQYAAVHGMPKRAAGEDYHLLSKVQKTSGVVSLLGAPIEIRARASQRTPFGTGQSVRGLLEGDELLLEAPEAFVALRRWLVRLEAFVHTGDSSQLRPEPTSPLDRAAWSVLKGQGAFTMLPELARRTKRLPDRRRRVLGWFDGLKSQQLLHGLRRVGYPPLPAHIALQRAPFTAGVVCGDPPGTSEVDWESVCRRLEALDMEPAQA